MKKQENKKVKKQYCVMFGNLFVEAESEQQAIDIAKNIIELDMNWLEATAELD